MTDESLVWYLAGPMRGFPQCNFPLFDAAARSLRDMGFTIKSPAEMDSPATRADALTCVAGEDRATYGGETPGQILARDVLEISDNIGGIIFLPSWWVSRGARLEAFVGLLTGKQFAMFHPKDTWCAATDGLYTVDTLVDVSADRVRAAIREFMP